MTTVTLNLPEEIASHLASLPAEERDAAECVTAVEEALADMDASRHLVPYDEVMKRWRDEAAARKG